jgi:electron transport complex protein RnfC
VLAFLPNISVIPLIQHSGGPATPVVCSGDRVGEGQLIGRGSGADSANIHAPVPGTVLGTVCYESARGIENKALVIQLEGAFERLSGKETVYSWEELSPFELKKLISECGIVEMEVAGRPVSDVLSTFHAVQGTITMVVRLVFDDPWLSADYVLCVERIAAVAEGSVIAARAAQATRILFAISQKERELGDKLLEIMQVFGIAASYVLVGSRYPQRNRRELELVLRSFEKKENTELGALFILGPATLAAIHDAVKYKKPVLDRYVACGGTALVKPQVMRARIGSRLGELFSQCGGFRAAPYQVAVGSPLLGRQAVSLDEPVTKTTYAVFAFQAETDKSGRAQKCIGCGECRSVCPIGLDPEELFKNINDQKQAASIAAQAMECHGCGCCEVVCPSKLPLVTTIINSTF